MKYFNQTTRQEKLPRFSVNEYTNFVNATLNQLGKCCCNAIQAG